jgi:hypothetical protein
MQVLISDHTKAYQYEIQKLDNYQTFPSAKLATGDRSAMCMKCGSGKTYVITCSISDFKSVLIQKRRFMLS